MKVKYIPTDVIHIILEYDGRLIYKKGKYVLNVSLPMFDSLHYCLKHKKIVFQTFPFYTKNIKHIFINKYIKEIQIIFGDAFTEQEKNKNSILLEDSDYFLNIPISRQPYLISGCKKDRQLTWLKLGSPNYK